MRLLRKEGIFDLAETVRIAVCQQNISFENKDYNLNKIIYNIALAKKKNADIVFFPEMSLTGFSMNIDKTSEKDFYNVDKIRSCAVENSISVGFGWVKSVGVKAENHYSVFSSAGEVVFDYVKIHPFSYAEEDLFYVGGNEVKFFHLNSICFSIFICYDLRFPEIFQAASKEASIIVVAANWPMVRKEHWKCLLKARSVENQCYIVGVNCFGKQNDIYYSGDSSVFNPDGKRICYRGEKEDLAVFEIENDTKRYREKFPVRNDRKIELYKSIL